LLALARGFNARHDETLIVVGASAAPPLVNAGFNVLVADEPNEAEAALLWSRFGELPRREASRLMEREWFAGLCLQAMLPSLEAALRDWRPDLVVREVCEYAGAIAADRAQIPHAQHGISTAAAEMSGLQAFTGATLDSYAPGLAKRVAASPYLTRFPASLDPSEYPSTLRYRDRGRATPSPLPDWWRGSSAPLIYLTLGTVATGTPQGVALLRAALNALTTLDARVLVATGSRGAIDELGEVGPTVHVEPWVNQDDVVAAAALVVCHGGSGTTFGALGAGVPLVFLPMFADQPTNARLVAEAGAGIVVAANAGSAAENARELARQPDAIRSAVVTVLETPSYSRAARVLESELVRLPTTDDVCEMLGEAL
jgi:hypothetical protein